MKDRRQFQFAELETWLNEHRVTEIECLVPDLTGVARGKILPREKFTEDRGMRLPEVVVATGVTGEYPNAGPFFDVVSRSDADMHLVADPTTVRIVPWAADPTAQVIHDCYDRHGALVPFAPRSVLRRVCEQFDRRGWSPVVAPELEFYLVARNTDPDQPLKAPIGRSGRAETSRQSYSIDAVNEFDPLFEDVYNYCEKMELNVDTLIHETGAGQMEINFFHSSAPLEIADEVFLLKRIVREAALRHGMYATFMAKPIAGEPGSAMHVHQSLVSKETGRNLFSNEDGTPSQEFFWYIGGLQKYIPAAMPLFAPYVNSYRRLARFTAAPINTQWGVDNRTVGIRAPVAEPQARRVENRVIGADVNPYLALAATLACGLLGIEQQLEPTQECKGDAYQSARALPRSLAEAVSLLRAEHDLAAVLGKEFLTVYAEIKDLEHEEFMRVISPGSASTCCCTSEGGAPSPPPIERSDRRPEVLVEAEEIGRVVLVFQCDEPRMVLASGRAMLSKLDLALQEEIIRSTPLQAITPMTEIDPALLLRRIDEAAKRGFAVVQNQTVIGDISIAAAITGHQGEPIGAVNISVPSTRWTVERAQEQLLPHVLLAATSISQARAGVA